MPKVEIEEKLSGKPEDVYSAVKEYFKKKDFLEKLGASIEWDDKGSCAAVKGDKFSGNFEIKGKGKDSLVCVSISLPLLLSPFKSKVKEELTKHIKRIQV